MKNNKVNKSSILVQSAIPRTTDLANKKSPSILVQSAMPRKYKYEMPKGSNLLIESSRRFFKKEGPVRKRK